jgi:hypothetical protein
MTSRIESKPPSSITMRSQPKAMPPCGGAPKAKASSRKPNFSCASSLDDAHDGEHALLDVAAVDTDRAAADLVAVADDVVGVGERRAGVGVEGVDPNSGLGEVKAWCTAVQAPEPTATSPEATGVGGRLEHGRVHDPQERPRVLGSIRSAAALGDLERGAQQLLGGSCAPAAKKMQSPGLAPTWRGQMPSRSASEMFLATGPPSCRPRRP